MKTQIVLAFRDDVVINGNENGSITITSRTRSFQIPAVTQGLQAAIQALTSAGATEDQLADLIVEFDGDAGLPIWYYRHHQLDTLGFLCYAVQAEENRLATLTAISPDFSYTSQVIDPAETYVLSRFAYSRRDPSGRGLLVESPLSHARLTVHAGIGGALLTELSTPMTCHELTHALSEGNEEVVTHLLSLLASANLLAKVSETGSTPEDEQEALRYWEFHDLLFHSRSRSGRHDAPCGGTFRFGKDTPAQPVVKAPMSTDVIDLHRPDMEALMKHDLPFTRILEERRSIRAYDEAKPLTLEQLGDFLYRTARVRKIIPGNGESRSYSISNRPYPNGGAMYELEIYVTVNRCEHLAPGLYHYQPHEHQLHQVADNTESVQSLLRHSSLPAPGTGQLIQPHVLLTITTRYPRVNWKYQSIAYALTLKNVGVLCQTMYLVATAMGLAPVAIGSGNSDLFAKASGVDYYAESPVGEFALSSAFVNPPNK